MREEFIWSGVFHPEYRTRIGEYKSEVCLICKYIRPIHLDEIVCPKGAPFQFRYEFDNFELLERKYMGHYWERSNREVL